jgi:MFS family permease
MKASKRRDPLLLRFSLYGFLKNQQYYEPFFLLVLRGKGLSYFEVGLLYSFREVVVNLMGIPAGFLADIYGRRTSLIVCFIAYIFSFLGFALGAGIPLLFVAMFAFAIGESFRTGTHKAMVFHHLRLEGREAEKAAVYGYTRSWSKAGSAISALLSGVLVLLAGSYDRIFLFAIPPYLLNILNVASYPAALEGELTSRVPSVRQLMATMWRETVASLKNPGLRGLCLESAALQAVSKSTRDYVQPLMVLALAGIALRGCLSNLNSTQRSAFLLGIVYFVLNVGAAIASRNAHRFERLDRQPTPWLWIAVATSGVLLMLGSGLRTALPYATLIAVASFVLLVFLENVWRPLFLDRLDDVSDRRFGAAVLSVEAQLSSLGVLLGAPLVGKVADHLGLPGVGGLVTLLALLTGVLSYWRKQR